MMLKNNILQRFILINVLRLQLFKGEMSHHPTWEAKFIPNIVETKTTIFKIILAVNWTYNESDQPQIKANCEVAPEYANFDSCSFDNSDVNVSNHRTILNNTYWSIDKKELIFKPNFNVQQITARRNEMANDVSLEVGKIKCCLKEIDSDSVQKIESSFLAQLQPNLNGSNEEFEPEVYSLNTRKSVPDVEKSGRVPILQVMFNSSPYIEHVYLHSPASLNTLQAFNVYKDKFRESIPKNRRSLKYVHGSRLRRLPLNLPERYVTLPAVTLNGKCVDASPVRFLLSQSSRCSYIVDETTCNSRKSLFNSRSYANNLHIFKGNESDEQLNVNVNYACQNVSECRLGNTSLRHQPPIKICENVVRKVEYAFGWFRGQLTYLNVTVVLANVTVDKPTYAFIDFLLRFTYDGQNQTLEDAHRRLQIEGYTLNQALMTTELVNNESQALSPYMYFLKTDKYGNCAFSVDGQSIYFGTDVYFGCDLKVDNSSHIKDTICNIFLSSEIISKSGKANSNNSDDLIPIFRENICNSAPNYILSKTSPKIWLSVIILYDVSGEINDLLFHQIRGMKIKSWTNVDCFECFKSSPVTLNLAVEFIKSVNATSNTKKFWLNQNQMPCKQDSCWTELTYPFTNSETDPTLLFADHFAIIARSACVFILITFFIIILLFFKLHYCILFF